MPAQDALLSTHRDAIGASTGVLHQAAAPTVDAGCLDDDGRDSLRSLLALGVAMTSLTDLHARLPCDASAATVHDAVLALCEEVQRQEQRADNAWQLLTDAVRQGGVDTAKIARLEREHDRLVTVVEVQRCKLEQQGEEQRLHVSALDRCSDRLDALERPTSADVPQLVVEVQRLTAERDEARRNAKQWEAIATGPDGTPGDVESHTAAAIADHLEQRAAAILAGPKPVPLFAQHRAAGLTDAVDALKSGTWRTP